MHLRFKYAYNELLSDYSIIHHINFILYFTCCMYFLVYLNKVTGKLFLNLYGGFVVERNIYFNKEYIRYDIEKIHILHKTFVDEEEHAYIKLLGCALTINCINKIIKYPSIKLTSASQIIKLPFIDKNMFFIH